MATRRDAPADHRQKLAAIDAALDEFGVALRRAGVSRVDAASIGIAARAAVLMCGKRHDFRSFNYV